MGRERTVSEEQKFRTLHDLCKCGHPWGDHANREPHACLHGLAMPRWKQSTPKCATKCQAFEAAEIENGRS